MNRNSWINIPKNKNESDFLQLFKEKEFLQLAGPGKKKIATLAAIIFFTLLTLCYALGSLDILKRKMDNPYTNWVDMPLSNTGGNSYDSLSSLIKYFDRDTAKKRFELNNVSGQVWTGGLFPKADDFTKIHFQKGRTIHPGEKLLKEILSPRSKNVLRAPVDGDSVFDKHDCGIIFTRTALLELGYKDWESIEKVAMKFENYIIYAEVLGIVKDLPDYCDFLCTPRFYNLLLNGSISTQESGVINPDTTNIVSVTSTLSDKARIAAFAEKFLSGSRVLNIKQEPIKISNKTEHYLYEIIFNHGNRPGVEAMKQLFDSTQNVLAATIEWHCIENRFQELSKPYFISFNFDDLGKIRSFKTFMTNRFHMNVNLAQVESKDNFKKVSSITYIVCITLFFFGMLSIVLFITNLLRTHLESMKPNLGTLKAFGLKDGWLKDTYHRIIAYFLFFAFAMAIAPLLLIVLGAMLLYEASPFIFFDWRIVAAIALIFWISLYFARKTTGTLVKASPGDLIYGR